MRQSDGLTFLTPHTHTALSGDARIFLDLRADTYLCVQHPSAASAGGTDDLAPGVVDELVEVGLLTRDPHQGIGLPERDIPRTRWRDVNLPGRAAPTIGDVGRFLLAFAIASARFRGRSVAQLAAVAPDRARPIAAGHRPIEQVVAAFECLRLFLPWRTRCLFRSFLLLHFLGLYGYTADWVFGVTAYPFRAHCWVARGEMLLGERASHVEEYAPILIVGRARS